METGFLNPIHDEEHFSSSFYNQGNGLDDPEHMLFGEMIIPDVIDYDNLWHSVDDGGTPSDESGTRKEDFQKMLYEWQHQLTYMQEPEAIKQIVPVAERATQEVSDMFSNRSSSSNTPLAASIDELFPPEFNKDIPFLDESNRVASPVSNEAVAAVETKSIKIIPDIEIKIEKEDQNVDVETVDEDIPLLMAGDLTSLLEQFEATEKVNSTQPTPVSPSPPRPSNKTIRDSLPAEVINRIKATRENHKKIISVIPAMPSKRTGRSATRMQDAGAALSRNKLLKLVTGGSSGESVQLDHDYCTNGDTTSNSSRSFYMSDSSEYPSQSSTPDITYSRLPDYFLASASCKAKEQTRHDNSSRKDSGLESGENSEDEVQPISEVKSKVVLKSVAGLKSINVVTENGIIIGSAPVIRNNVPMVSVLKKNIKLESLLNKQKVSNSSSVLVPTSVASSTQVNMESTQESSKKKKLNLEEYRVRREERERIRSQESSRANSPIHCSTPPAQPDSTTISQEGVPKEKPIMFSVEVQTQTCDFVDLSSSKSPKEQEKSRTERKEKRNDLKHRSYRSRHASSSSSSSSIDSKHRRSHKRKRRSRSNKRGSGKNSVSRMWSRSRSRSSSRSHSLASSRSRSRSRSRDRRQKWRSRSPRRSNPRYSNNQGFHNREGNRDRNWHRNRSPMRMMMMRTPEFGTQEKVRQVEERRVIYVGRIDEGTTKADLRSRFQKFGDIVDISVHFRERGDNYGFVTFKYKADAYQAVEHGNDDPKQPRYDLCFGGRRAFCKQRYADLDGLATSIHDEYIAPIPQQPRSTDSFDLLLHEAKAKLRKRSSV